MNKPFGKFSLHKEEELKSEKGEAGKMGGITVSHLTACGEKKGRGVERMTT